MTGVLETPVGRVPRVQARLSAADRLGGCKVRWGIGRMDYTVVPGLYALGEPGAESPVLVSANYKLSFDSLRQELDGLDAWLLALDTNGINVWCAAGKGTMGSSTLSLAVKGANLKKLVSHRRLVVPQLAGPGVSAHWVKRHTGFTVTWGPVQAADLPRFLERGMKAEPKTRLKEFPLYDRAVLVPMELVPALKFLPLAAVLWLIAWLAGSPGLGLYAAAALLAGSVTASVAGPLLLPWLPGRAFALKGIWLGLLTAAVLMSLWRPEGRLLAAAATLIVTSLSSLTLMNFTGASTYTSLSGVRREMRLFVPLQVLGGALGLAAWALALWRA